MLQLKQEKSADQNDIEAKEDELKKTAFHWTKQMNKQIDELHSEVLEFGRNDHVKKNRDVQLSYQELLKLSIDVMEQLRELIGIIFMRMRLFINDYWRDLRGNRDLLHVRHEFDNDINCYIQRWEKIIDEIKRKMEETKTVN